MSDLSSSDFPIAKDAYLAFDGLTIKEKIKQRLNQTGVFTDQNYEGSNLSALNDVVAMVFSLLIYNLNKTANEGQFSEALLYENINRIVKDIDYKPIGHQTATLNYSLLVNTLNAGMYQGSFIEYPTITPQGNVNELIHLTTNDKDLIDNFLIDVYVKPLNGKWKKWKKSVSLFLHNATEEVFELRFNENRRYELKFGNDINGKKLKTTDQVAIYYLKSDGEAGEVVGYSIKEP